jgi:hypothetical protein
MIDGIERLSDPTRPEERARRLLRRAATRDGKSLKRLRVAERKSRSEELSGARKKLRNARRKLSKACRLLPDGGASLLR